MPLRYQRAVRSRDTKMPLAKARRLVSSSLISATLIRGLLSNLSSFSGPSIRLSHRLSLSFFPLACWSTKLARDSRGLSLLVSSRLVRSLSRGPSCFVPSVPGAQCDIYGFLLGPCVEAAIIPRRVREREKGGLPSTPRTLSLLPGMDTGSKCSSQGRDVKPQPPPPTTMMVVAVTATTATVVAVAARTTRSYECSASGTLFLCLPFFPSKKRCMRASCARKDREAREVEEVENALESFTLQDLSSWVIHGGTHLRKG